ncbi:YoaK family protein [Sinorhizobium alkalisoli]|uniref:Uncharacterized protein n=1 Tax=Sinorhizobium alkalisoli TaxID=1752398 RepID=A0A1E3VH28_9HYPH|nr:YoaK family protein [Sinorhizobium alkalisoli]MCA1491349.1 DUF1275 domain-containing protein [Ensifer sp. NBAIM29]MCG5481117.1 DUF1275 family protein [Sinorhizobium alkalisoli]ODR92834.1 hypothetical protein A8M32_02710 [Sinorhizobium alkalisoli]QFI70355.1 transmembrane protein [Sinorhizobium alkalisoli]
MRQYLRNLTAKERNATTDRHLAFYLTFVAGAANAGGFMAVQQYTSHMSGVVSAIADNIVLGKSALVVAGLVALASFVAGAATSAILINWGRRLELQAEYALPLMVEALLLIGFATIGPFVDSQEDVIVSVTIALLCFIMGLQNAIITKLSGARIRTTHVTGLVTDAGIELGKLLYWNGGTPGGDRAPVRADRQKLRLLTSLIGLFLTGGVCGAIFFSACGMAAALFLAAPLTVIAALPVVEDLRAVLGR